MLAMNNKLSVLRSGAVRGRLAFPCYDVKLTINMSYDSNNAIYDDADVVFVCGEPGEPPGFGMGVRYSICSSFDPDTWHTYKAFPYGWIEGKYPKGRWMNDDELMTAKEGLATSDSRLWPFSGAYDEFIGVDEINKLCSLISRAEILEVTWPFGKK
jgi:hypothetical protein